MTVNDLVYEIAARAKYLADLRLPVLRRIVESKTGANTRGKLLEEQLIDEFIEDFPREIEE